MINKSLAGALFGLVLAVAVYPVPPGVAHAAAPSVETRSADVDDDSVTMWGELNPRGETTDFWFEYGTTSGLNEDTTIQHVGDFNASVDVFHNIRGLDRDRTYFFRLVAENDDGISRGSILTFRTDDDFNGGGEDLEVFTGSARVVSDTSAVLEGSAELDSFDTASAWFRYGQSPGFLSSESREVTVFGDFDEFSQSISGLVPNTTYYYQAVAENGSDLVRGQVRSFTTSGSGGGGGGGGQGTQAPDVATGASTVLGRNSVQLRAQVNPNGTLSSVWFEFGRTPSLGGATRRDPAGSGSFPTEYQVTMNGLSAGTTYYYRAAAQNSFGIDRGQILSFRTQGLPPAPAPAPTPGAGGTGGAGDDGEDDPAPAGPIEPGCLEISPMLSSQDLQPLEDFSYSVTYRNGCGQTLSGARLQVTLPDAMDFAGTSIPFLSRDANVIIYDIGTVASNFEAAVVVDGRVKEEVNEGETLVFQANMTFDDPRGILQASSAHMAASVSGGAPLGGADDEASTSTLGASVADALGGLFYSGWFWTVLLLIVIALFVFWLASRRRGGEEDEDAVHEA